MRLVRLERQQSRVADDIRAALASLGRGSTVVGGIALIGVGTVTDRPVEAVVLLPHGVIIVIGVDLPDPALRLEAPLGAEWKADGWPLVADDDAINPATEALDLSQVCESRIAELVPGTAPVGTIVAVGPYVETVDQPASDLAGPVRVLHPTPTTMLAAAVSLATAHRPRSVDQVRALIRGLAPDAPDFSDEILLGEGFSRFSDDTPPESLWDTAPRSPGTVATARPPAGWRTETPSASGRTQLADPPAAVAEADHVLDHASSGVDHASSGLEATVVPPGATVAEPEPESSALDHASVEPDHASSGPNHASSALDHASVEPGHTSSAPGHASVEPGHTSSALGHAPSTSLAAETDTATDSAAGEGEGLGALGIPKPAEPSVPADSAPVKASATASESAIRPDTTESAAETETSASSPPARTPAGAQNTAAATSTATDPAPTQTSAKIPDTDAAKSVALGNSGLPRTSAITPGTADAPGAPADSPQTQTSAKTSDAPGAPSASPQTQTFAMASDAPGVSPQTQSSAMTSDAPGASPQTQTSAMVSDTAAESGIPASAQTPAAALYTVAAVGATKSAAEPSAANGSALEQSATAQNTTVAPGAAQATGASTDLAATQKVAAAFADATDSTVSIPAPTAATNSNAATRASATKSAEPETSSDFADFERTETLGKPPTALPVFPGAEQIPPYRPAADTERTESLELPSSTSTETLPRPTAAPAESYPHSQPNPAPRQKPPAPTSRTVRWLPLGAIGLLVVLVVAAVVVATRGDDTAAAPVTPPPAPASRPVSQQPASVAPAQSLQFSLRAADGDQRCASHAFGDAQASLQQTSCSGVRRASYATTVDGRAGAVTVGIVAFPDAAQAAAFKAVADTPGGGGILDLAAETGKWGTPAPRFENAAYTSRLEGTSVRVVQAVWVPGPSTADDPGLVRAAKAALDLPAR
ncbi:hypothetical protein [Amycolatopsis sp. WQ 127309]|uniref:hypothetical protein n=1 Tax=Amycolatopsis sp. WQ 127309 TaxID=2932773 RepID=UPI001FF5C1B1|nr:hypothetical protein [Amycolatopsis sp. WQ 127309]UOZ11077.1 hypothetical protein MUY22_23525 [Amycolatopsis sp. WQ 127309]